MTSLRLWLVVAILSLIGGTGGFPLYAQESPPQAIGRIPTRAVSPKVVRASQEAVRGTDRSGKDGPMVKVGQELALIYHQHRVEGKTGIRQLRETPSLQKRARRDDPGAPSSRVFSPLSADGDAVTIEAVATGGTATPLLSDLRRLGLENGDTVGRLVSGRLPISALQEAAQLETLRGMMPSYARSYAGQVGSEADTAHASFSVRQRLGLDGDRQKICALSDSYDQAGDPDAPSASDDIQTGDLPGQGNPEGRTTPVDVIDDSDTAGSDEGRAMLQLIHDIAPGATLGFHTATVGLAAFADGIRTLADPSQGDCDVIVDDIGYNIEPFYQDGPVTNAINDVVENEDVVYFSSAGNDGQNAYKAPFRNSGNQGLTSSSAVAHDFDPGPAVDTKQQITIAPGGEFGFFTFQWTDPSVVVDGSRGPDTDIDVALVNDTSGIVTESTIDNIADGRPFETLDFTNEGNIDTDGDGVADSTFHLVIEKYEGPDPEEVRYIYSGVNYSIDEYDTLGATIYGHPMAEKAMAVAATPFFYTPAYVNVDSPYLESFSSKGGIPILFDENGNSISPVDREKPDVTGTDGIDNTFFGTDLDFSPTSSLGGIDSDPFPNFFGTSAAAPNIAAIAALIRQARPTLTHEEVYERLRTGTQDITERVTRNGQLQEIAVGKDPWSGTGFVLAEEAVPPPRTLQIVDLAADGSISVRNEGRVELSWTLIGEGRVDAFVIERQFFDGPFTEQARVLQGRETQFSNTIEKLPPGKHTFRITAVRNDSVITTSTTERILQGASPNVLLYPNPFQSRFNLSVTLPSEDPVDVEVTVYDALGRRVATPTESRTVNRTQSIQYDASELGISGAGVYFFRIEGQTFTQTVQGVYQP